MKNGLLIVSIASLYLNEMSAAWWLFLVVIVVGFTVPVLIQIAEENQAESKAIIQDYLKRKNEKEGNKNSEQA